MKITPLLSRFKQYNIHASLDKLVLRNRIGGQIQISGPLVTYFVLNILGSGATGIKKTGSGINRKSVQSVQTDAVVSAQTKQIRLTVSYEVTQHN